MVNTRLPGIAIRLDLTDDETAALLNLLTETIENDRYPASPRIRRVRGILAKLGPMGPAPPPARPPTQDASRGRAGRDVILAQAKEIPGQSRGICVTS